MSCEGTTGVGRFGTRENNPVAQNALNIGLLGCGAIAQFAHLPALARTHRARLVALCDAAEDLLQTVGRKYGVVRLHTCYDGLLADDEVQAVLIAVPDAMHVPLAVRALYAGKHVLVEKPLGANSAECVQLVRMVRETGLVLQVGSMKRHDPGLAFARQFVHDRAGDVLSVSGVYRDTTFRSAMQESCLDRLLVSEHAVKPPDPKANPQHYHLFTQGAHLFDSIRYLAGDITAVYAQMAVRSGQFSWHGLLEFDDGARGHFELTCKACSDWREEYTVNGEHGSVAVQVSLPFYHRPAIARAFDGRIQQWSQPLGGYSNAYVNQLEAFAAAVLDGQLAHPDVRDGLAVMRILEAVEKAVVACTRIEVDSH